MSQVYTSDFLSIEKQNSILIQEWTAKKLSVDQFQTELKNFLRFFKKVRPQGLLWLKENFNLHIPSELHEWIEKSILEPQYKCGLRKVAFTVPREENAHLSLIDSFNNVNSILPPKYFMTKNQALDFLKEEIQIPEEPKEVKYEIKRSYDKTEIRLEIDHKNLPHAIKHLDKLKAQFHFRMQNKEHFDQLTLRELEVFKSISMGKLNKIIAAELYLSESTVATHRKTIIKKLNIRSTKDWQQYASAFL